MLIERFFPHIRKAQGVAVFFYQLLTSLTPKLWGIAFFLLILGSTDAANYSRGNTGTQRPECKNSEYVVAKVILMLFLVHFFII